MTDDADNDREDDSGGDNDGERHKDDSMDHSQIKQCLEIIREKEKELDLLNKVYIYMCVHFLSWQQALALVVFLKSLYIFRKHTREHIKPAPLFNLMWVSTFLTLNFSLH